MDGFDFNFIGENDSAEQDEERASLFLLIAKRLWETEFMFTAKAKIVLSVNIFLTSEGNNNIVRHRDFCGHILHSYIASII